MCSKLHSKFFSHTNTSNSHNNPLRKVLLFIPFYRQGKSKLLKATKLVSGRAEPLTQAG